MVRMTLMVNNGRILAEEGLSYLLLHVENQFVANLTNLFVSVIKPMMQELRGGEAMWAKLSARSQDRNFSVGREDLSFLESFWATLFARSQDRNLSLGREDLSFLGSFWATLFARLQDRNLSFCRKNSCFLRSNTLLSFLLLVVL